MGATRYFPIEEYEHRWQRVHDEMARRGYDAAVVWSRSGGGYERSGDVLYLANFYSQASGQGWDTPVFNARSFSAVILQRGQVPELQADEAWPRKDLVATDRIAWHHDPIKGVAQSLNERGITGRVAFVGGQVLPVKYARELEAMTPRIDWEFEDELVLAVRRIKSRRELDCMREAGEIMTRALTRYMEGLIACEREADAAAAAVSIVVAAGGAIHMAPCNHGDMIQYWVRDPIVGHSQEAPRPGDLVRCWLYGPIREGYWLDPGRTAVAGGRPSAAQRELVEANARLVDRLIDAIRPGKSFMEVAALGDRLMAEFGGTKDQAAEKWPHFGHSIGLFIETPYIGATMCSESDRFHANMAIGVEAFASREGVGSAGLEKNFIVGENGNEVLDRIPTIWW
ncbi:MAG: M24 family metallopeptidase [Candidatus Binatia bacterium]